MNGINRKKEPKAIFADELRPEYDLTRLKGGVRGKYFSKASAGSNLVLIDPDLSKIFPDSASVNRTLRVVADAAQALTPAKRPARSR